MSKKIVFASGNLGKLAEVGALLEPRGFILLPLSNFTDESPEETGVSFIENALLKARFACRVSGLPALADDSGLVVNALRGAPGIYSARYAGAQANDQENLELLLANLRAVKTQDRSARFCCAAAWMEHQADPMPRVAEGYWAGKICEQPSGDGGFGYDPIFFLPDLQCTAAELSKQQKNRLSHRGKALRSLLAQCDSLEAEVKP